MKVRFIETNFVTNDKKGVVTCIVKARLSMGSRQGLIGTCYWNRNSLEQLFTIHGCAKCHPDDKFSLEVGKRIAESRAKKAVYARGKELAKKSLGYLEIFKEDVLEMMTKLDNFRTKEDEHIGLVINEVDE